MKKIIVVLIILISMNSLCFADSTINDLIDGQLESLGAAELENLANSLNSDINTYFKIDNIGEIFRKIIKGEDTGIGKNLVQGVLKIFTSEIYVNISMFMKIIIISILCAVIQNIGGTLGNETVSKSAYYVCYMALIVLLTISIKSSMNIGYNAINDMVNFIDIVLPIMFIALLSITTGGLAVLRPLILVSITVMVNIVKSIIIPMIYMGAILSIVNNITSRKQISRLKDFVNQVILGLLGATTTGFILIMSVQKIFAVSFNGLTAKTAKMALDKMVPVIGGFLSSAYDIVLNCSVLVKNGVGVVGLIMLFMIAAIPIIKIATLMLMFKFSAVLLEPILDTQLVDTLGDIAHTLFLMLACLACVMIMFLVAITIIMSASNAALMMR